MFCFTFSKKSETPPPPFLTTSVFSDKDFKDWATPPPLIKKTVKKWSQMVKMVKNGKKI